MSNSWHHTGGISGHNVFCLVYLMYWPVLPYWNKHAIGKNHELSSDKNCTRCHRLTGCHMLYWMASSCNNWVFLSSSKQGPVSISDKTSCKVSWTFKATRLVFRAVQLQQNSTGTPAAGLLRLLPNIIAMRWIKLLISLLWVVKISCDKTSYWLLKWVPVFFLLYKFKCMQNTGTC